MFPRIRSVIVLAASGTLAVSAAQPPQPQTSPQSQQQPSEISLIIGEQIGTPPRFAVPDFIALSNDPETAAAAKLIGEVVWNDLDFEREFYLIPRDTYRTIPAATSFTTVPFDRWHELGADGVVIGSVQRTSAGIRVQMRLFNIRSQASVFSREYTGTLANPRLYAHTIADEIHQNQRALKGVARTKIVYASDREGAMLTGPVENRTIKELWMVDYDGANQRRMTSDRSLAIAPAWSPDGRAIAYTSYRRGFPDLFIAYIFEGRFTTPASGTDAVHNFLPAWSPDGTRLAFMSNRDGNLEIYIVDRDGGNLRRLTRHPSIDVSPTWSPTGNEIAFTSDRSGRPQIYIVGVDGLGLRRLTFESYCDRPTWSPAPFSEIAYASRTGPGYDIKVFDLATSEVRQITFGEGSNESPSYSVNGRHIAFTSTRKGRKQIFTIGRDGRHVKQVTTEGNNEMASWSR